METVLILAPEGAQRSALEGALGAHFRVRAAASCEEGAALLWAAQPAALVIALDPEGLYFLEGLQGLLPEVVMALGEDLPPALAQRLHDLGVCYCLKWGCGADVAAAHLRGFLGQRVQRPDAQEQTAAHLRRLGVPPGGGFEDLRVGAPLFRQDVNGRMGKEFYPAVAALRGRENWRQVEKAIRDARQYAYRHRNEAVWRLYFPDTSRCPRNREFIARLAELLD